MIDLYCERYGPELLAEPFNAFTNIAFVVAAWAVWRLARYHKSLNVETWLLIIFSAMVGIASTLFHTFATNWSQMLDIISILVFQLIFIWLYLLRVANIHAGIVAVATAGFLVTVLFTLRFSEMLNGTLLYVPAIIVLLGFSIYHFMQCQYEPRALFAATGVFILALIFRSIDTAVCPDFPIGTHFLWHILVAVVLYLATRALILNQVNSRCLANG